MTIQIVSIDAGNGGTNGVKANEKSTRQVYFPSVRATATGDSLGLGAGLELQYEFIDWGGHRYVVGDDVLKISRKGIERHQGAFRYGDEFHQFLVATAIARLGVHQGEVDLTVFAPPGIYNEAKPVIEERFMHNGGNVSITLSTDKKTRSWQYKTVRVFPEGIGAAASFVLDEEGNLINSDVLSGETVILDMGMYTLDALQMSDGNFNPESLGTATWEGQGLKAHLLDPVLAAVKKKGEDFQLLTVDDIDRVIRQGILEEDYTLRVAGLEVDIEPLVEKYTERYASWIANNIVDGVFNGLRGVKSAILVGGGAMLTEKYLRKWYDKKLLRFDEHETTQKIAAIDANAVGGIRLAKMSLQRA